MWACLNISMGGDDQKRKKKEVETPINISELKKSQVKGLQSDCGGSGEIGRDEYLINNQKKKEE